MRNSLLKIFAGCAAFLMIAMLANTSFGQRRNRWLNYSKQQIEQLLERIEERNDIFTKSFDEALDDSRLDTSRTEENYTDRSRDLENATDELRREFDHNDTRGETRENVRKVLVLATDINRIMNTRNFGARAENDWKLLRSELNALAKIYGFQSVGSKIYRVTPVRTSRNIVTGAKSYIIRGYSQQQVEELLERIEERNDAFTNQLNKSLDRSRIDGSRAEDNITERARELENATDELRREFDHNDSRAENLPEARNVLRTATIVDNLVKRRNFGGLTESTWAVLRSELNVLAKLYGLPAVGSKKYR